MDAFHENHWVWVCNWTWRPKVEPKGKKGAKQDDDDDAHELPRVAAKVTTPGHDSITVSPMWGDICPKCRENTDDYGPDSQPRTITLQAGGLEAGEAYAILMDESNVEGRQDMVDLADLKVGELMHNLRIRYKAKPMLIYTYVGDILIVMNPMENIGMTTSEMKDMYMGRVLGDPTLMPHIYAVADEAYRMMIDHRSNQSIVISGESGAGKSESTKHALGYLAYAAKKDPNAQISVNKQILATSEVLEAFGNAKTKRNHNSSRFGKFIEIQYDADGVIIGAQIEQYLLEKSRIVAQETTERNYHVFYMMLVNLSPEDKASMHLTDVKDYIYLIGPNGSNVDSWPYRPDGVTDLGDREKWPELLEFMDELTIPREFQTTLWRIMAAVLHCGQLRFGDMDKEGLVSILNPEVVGYIAELLGLDEAALDHCLKKKLIMGTTYKNFNEKQARDNADGLAKAVYGNTFISLVENVVNSMIHAKKPISNWIGVLDIFGFESFQERRKGKRGEVYIDTFNKFEQLCINLTNEQLQHFFYFQLIPKQLKKYKDEKIQVGNIYFADNTPCLKLVAGSKKSLFSLLDGVTKMSTTDRKMQADMSIADKRWLEDIKSNHPGCDGNRLVDPGARRDKENDYLGYFDKDLKHNKDLTDFCVFHYAGQVWYSVEGAVERNKDAITTDVQQCLSASSVDFIRDMFPPPDDNARKKQTTVAKKFASQLNDLQENLETTEPFFVRCVKPNCVMEKGGFLEDHKVLEQLICAGMYAVIEMRQNGYPVERPAAKLVESFEVLEDDKEALKAMASDEERALHLCALVEAAYHDEVQNKDGMLPYQAGLTRMFLKDEMFKAMNKAKAKAIKLLREKQKSSIEIVKALVKWRRENELLPEREEVARANAVRFKRKKELIAQGHSEAEALQIMEEERKAEEARIEAEYKAAHYDPVAAQVAPAQAPVGDVLAALDAFLTLDETQVTPKDKKETVRTRRAALAALNDKVSSTFDKFTKDYHDTGLEAELSSLIGQLKELAVAEAAAVAADNEERAWEVEEEARLIAEAEERARREEEERLERERQEELRRKREEEERIVAAKKAAIEKEKRRRKDEKMKKIREREERRRRDEEQRRTKREEEQRHREEERIRMKEETERMERLQARQAKHAEKEEGKLHAKTNALKGTAVKFNDMLCEVAYVGKLPYSGSGDFVGLICPRVQGEMTDGTILGEKLFDAPNGMGKFVRGDMLHVVDEDDDNFRDGDRVWIKNSTRIGEVMYVGSVDFASGIWVGVKLDTPDGRNNGTVKGRAYFKCDDNYGVFTRPANIAKIQPWSEEFVGEMRDRYITANNLDEISSDDEDEIAAHLEEIGEQAAAQAAAAAGRI